MAMVTQCPHCSTAFNVTPEQLFARDGRVRCGQCRQVFDGLVNLTSVEALQAGVPPPLAEASDAELRAKVVAIEAERAAPAAGFAPINWPMVPEVPVVPMPLLAEAAPAQQNAAGPAAAAPVPSTLPDDAAEQPATASELAAPTAGSTTPSAPTATQVQAAHDANEAIESNDAHDGGALPEDSPRRAVWPWAMAATLAAVALAAQALYVFRDEAAARVPGLRPALAQACEWAHCVIRPLQKPSALAIQASDLLILDKARPHLVQLIVTMQNQSAMDVGYPAIDLVLNDRFDHAVARRVFVPADYLRGYDAAKSTIAASGTTTVRIDLDVSELSAGGFALLLIPAPQT